MKIMILQYLLWLYTWYIFCFTFCLGAIWDLEDWRMTQTLEMPPYVQEGQQLS